MDSTFGNIARLSHDSQEILEFLIGKKRLVAYIPNGDKIETALLTHTRKLTHGLYMSVIQITTIEGKVIYSQAFPLKHEGKFLKEIEDRGIGALLHHLDRYKPSKQG